MITVQQAIDKVKRDQMTAIYGPKMKDLRMGQKNEIQCFDKNASNTIPRYTLIILDTPDGKVLKKRTCAAFITPQGKERESMFGTDVGRQNLLK